MKKMALILTGVLLAAGALVAAEPAPVKAKKAAVKAPARTQALVAKGKKAYTTYCVACHGDKGDGKGPAGAALKPAPRNFGKDTFKQGTSTVELFKTITHGLPKTLMVGYSYLPEEDRWGIAYYVGDFLPKKKKK